MFCRIPVILSVGQSHLHRYRNSDFRLLRVEDGWSLGWVRLRLPQTPRQPASGPRSVCPSGSGLRCHSEGSVDSAGDPQCAPTQHRANAHAAEPVREREVLIRIHPVTLDVGCPKAGPSADVLKRIPDRARCESPGRGVMATVTKRITSVPPAATPLDPGLQ